MLEGGEDIFLRDDILQGDVICVIGGSYIAGCDMTFLKGGSPMLTINGEIPRPPPAPDTHYQGAYFIYVKVIQPPPSIRWYSSPSIDTQYQG